MNTKNNQRSRLTRMLLKNSYMSLVRERPVGKITVKDICEGAEVNRSTFYLYYNEPNDILMELEDETISLVEDSLYSIGASEETSPDAQSYLLSFLREIRKSGELLKTLLVENSDPHFRRKLQAVALKMAESAFNVDLESESKSATYLYIVSGSIELIIDWLKSDYATSEQTMCKLLYKLCEGSLKGVCE